MDFTLFLGGVRSGKTRLGQSWAQKAAATQLMVATCHANDPEMLQRIALHKKSRGPSWLLLEEPLEPCEAIALFRKAHPDFNGAIVLDSLGMWINNLMIQNLAPSLIMARCQRLAAYFARLDLPCAIISEECGLGLAPMSTIDRKYVDILGTANQLMGRVASRAALVVAGLPLILKGSRFSNQG